MHHHTRILRLQRLTTVDLCSRGYHSVPTCRRSAGVIQPHGVSSQARRLSSSPSSSSSPVAARAAAGPRQQTSPSSSSPFVAKAPAATPRQPQLASSRSSIPFVSRSSKQLGKRKAVPSARSLPHRRIASPEAEKIPVSAFIALNRRIVKADTEEQILQLYETHHFNPSNFATALHRLATTPTNAERRDALLRDSRFHNMLDDIYSKYCLPDNNNISNGIRALGARTVASILHSLAKLKYTPDNNNVAQHLLEGLEDPDTVKWFLQQVHSHPKTISNLLWSTAQFQISIPSWCPKTLVSRLLQDERITHGAIHHLPYKEIARPEHIPLSSFLALNRRIQKASNDDENDAQAQILKLYDTHHFRPLNFATALHRLATSDERDALLRDSRFQQMLEDIHENYCLSDTISEGIRTLGARDVASILHSLAILKCTTTTNNNNVAQRLLDGLEDPETAKWFLQETRSHPNAIANLFWSTAQFQFLLPSWCPKILVSRLLDHEGMKHQTIHHLPYKEITRLEQIPFSSFLALNRQIIAVSTDNDPDEQILQLCESYHFNPVNFATALHRLTITTTDNTERRDALLRDDRFQTMLEEFQSAYCHPDKVSDGIRTLGARSVASILHSLAKLKCPADNNTLAQSLLEGLEDHDTAEWFLQETLSHPQTMSNLLWAASQLQPIIPSWSPEILISRFLNDERIAKEFVRHPQCLANSIWACAKMLDKSNKSNGTPTALPRLFQVLHDPRLFEHQKSTQEEIDDKSTKIGVFLPQHIVNMAWACAVANTYVPALFDALEKQMIVAVQKPSSPLSTQFVANAAWACAKLEVPLSDTLVGLCNDKERFLPRASCHELAQALWATATMATTEFGHDDAMPSPRSPPHHPLCQFVSQNAKTLFFASSTSDTSPPSVCHSQAIAMSIYSLSVLQHPTTFELLELLDEEELATSFLNTASAGDLCNVALACVAMKNHPIPRPLLQAPHDKLNFSPRQGAQWVLACAKQGVWAKAHVAQQLPPPEDLEGEGGVKKDVTPRDLADLVWACATTAPHGDDDDTVKKLCATLEDHSEWMIDKGSAQAISKCAWACAKMGVHTPRLFQEIFSKTMTAKFFDSPAAHPQSIATCIWACGVLNIQHPALVEGLHEHITWFLETAHPIELTNCLWGLMVLGYSDDDHRHASIRELVWKRLLERIVEDKDGKILHEAMASQILFIDAVMQIEDQNKENPSARLMNDSLRTQLSELLPGAPQPSDNSKQVSNVLSSLGWKHECEVSAFALQRDSDYASSSLLSLDMADLDTGVAVEYNGPFHYVKDSNMRETDQVNGTTACKQRVLKKLGWEVISLDWKERVPLPKNGYEEEEWLKAKMKEAGVALE